jgi:4-hydroxy-2-oxoglutarate aldolase
VRAAERGADAVLVRPPTTYRGQMTEVALEAHYRAVADASPVPILLYNQPLAFGVELSAGLVARLSTHPNVGGLKESSGNVGLVGEHVAGLAEGFPVLTGVASTMYASLLVGATGIIVAVANVVPEICVRLYDDVRGGRWDEALTLQRALTPLGRAVTMQYGVPGLKAAMTLAGYVGTEPRRPMTPVGPEVIDALRALMRDVEERTGFPVLAQQQT